MEKKDNVKYRYAVRIIPLLLIFCFFLFFAWVYSNRQDWVGFGLSIVVVISTVIWTSGIIVCREINKRFDRLEEILHKQNRDEKNQKVIDQNTDKSSDA